MLRIAACALATLAAATIAVAADLTDAANTFHVKIPNGWNAEPPSIQLSLAVTSPRRPETGGNCTFVTGSDESKSMSQTEFDDFLATQVNEGFWRTVASSISGVREGTVDGGGKTRNGRMVFYAKITSKVVGRDGTFSLTQRMEVQGVPGRLYVVTCSALSGGYDREAADFDAILESFEPVLSGTPGRRQTLGPGNRMASIAPVVRSAMIASTVRVQTR